LRLGSKASPRRPLLATGAQSRRRFTDNGRLLIAGIRILLDLRRGYIRVGGTRRGSLIGLRLRPLKRPQLLFELAIAVLQFLVLAGQVRSWFSSRSIRSSGSISCCADALTGSRGADTDRTDEL
jgi:hypothetical protein